MSEERKKRKAEQIEAKEIRSKRKAELVRELEIKEEANRVLREEGRRGEGRMQCGAYSNVSVRLCLTLG